MTDNEIRQWLKNHEVNTEKFAGAIEYDCPKCAMVSSCTPFGLLATWINERGEEMWFINGKNVMTVTAPCK